MFLIVYYQCTISLRAITMCYLATVPRPLYRLCLLVCGQISHTRAMELIEDLRTTYPDFRFEKADNFYWSAQKQTIYYNESADNKTGVWSLLHEVGHGLLTHQKYESDFELLQLEMQAWEKAKEISKNYKINIPEDHIQDCLDTYRDWLHARGKCPTCQSQGLQSSSREYTCLRCGSKWQVSTARFCRPYRRKSISNNPTA